MRTLKESLLSNTNGGMEAVTKEQREKWLESDAHFYDNYSIVEYSSELNKKYQLTNIPWSQKIHVAVSFVKLNDGYGLDFKRNNYMFSVGDDFPEWMSKSWIENKLEFVHFTKGIINKYTYHNLKGAIIDNSTMAEAIRFKNNIKYPVVIQHPKDKNIDFTKYNKSDFVLIISNKDKYDEIKTDIILTNSITAYNRNHFANLTCKNLIIQSDSVLATMGGISNILCIESCNIDNLDVRNISSSCKHVIIHTSKIGNLQEIIDWCDTNSISNDIDKPTQRKSGTLEATKQEDRLGQSLAEGDLILVVGGSRRSKYASKTNLHVDVQRIVKVTKERVFTSQQPFEFGDVIKITPQWLREVDKKGIYNNI